MTSGVYITGLGNISPRKTYDKGEFLNELQEVETTHLKVMDPNYRDFISGDILRRMGRISKMGIAAAKIAMNDACCDMPDAIITGTGLGCIEDTEKFLNSMITNKEEFLTPTSFIQSTHNTVGAQIALLLKCHNYNFTYVHRALSFESALLDGITRIRTGTSGNVLVGSIDELTANTISILQRLGQCKRKPVNPMEVLSDHSRGAIAGEGSAFFMLSPESGKKSYAVIQEVRTIFRPDPEELLSVTSELVNTEKPDAVILGISGDPFNDSFYGQFRSQIFRDLPQLYYKHLCGEYHTASAFSLWLAARILETQKVPEVVRLNEKSTGEIRSLLIYNQYRNIDHSFISVSRA